MERGQFESAASFIIKVKVMPYKDRKKQNEYQRKRLAKRRQEYFSDKFCVECGTNNNLELDHIDPSTKTTHRIWSFTKERRDSEFAKCQVLCRTCHKKKTIIYLKQLSKKLK